MEKVNNKKNLRKEYVLIAILLLLFIVLSIFVVGGKTDLFDERVFNNLIKLKTSLLSKILYVITNIGSSIGVLLVLGITAFIFMRKKIFSDFKYLIINVGSGVALMEIIKNIVRRIRPSWKWITQAGFSFPSGHTISAVLLYGTLIMLINKKLKGKMRIILTIIFSFMIFLIPVSRIYFGVHYLTDIIGGFILGAVILLISNIFMNKEFNNDKDKIK